MVTDLNVHIAVTPQEYRKLTAHCTTLGIEPKPIGNSPELKTFTVPATLFVREAGELSQGFWKRLTICDRTYSKTIAYIEQYLKRED